MGGLDIGDLLRQRINRLALQIPPQYFQSKRWFGSKTRTITGYRVLDFSLLETEPDVFGLLLLEISYKGAESELYQVPLALKPQSEAQRAVRAQPADAAFAVPTSSGDVWAYDAFVEERFCALLLGGMYDDRKIPMPRGTLVFRHVPGLLDSGEVNTVRPVISEQSNTSIILNEALILKTFRKLSPGLNPDFEVPYFLTTHTDFAHVPKVAGFIEYQPASAQRISIGVLQEFVASQGDGYTNTVNRFRDYLANVQRFIDDGPDLAAEERTEQALRHAGGMREAAHRLGQITGLMHNALASDSKLPDFRPERITGADIERWEESIVGLINRVIEAVEAKVDRLPPGERELLQRVTANEAAFLTMISGLNVLERDACHKARYHGDFHLGQVLETGIDFTILDFEGEPARSLAERRAKHCPLKDVAGMLRSFTYAANAILLETWKEHRSDPSEKAELEAWALAWESLARTAFLVGYREATGLHTGPRFAPANETDCLQVIKIFELEKAFYELNYEFNNRPSWISIPASGLLRLLQPRSS